MSTQKHDIEEQRVGNLLMEGLAEQSVGTPCLNDEALDSLIADTLPNEQRSKALEHIAGCSECRHAFVATSRLAAVEAEMEAEESSPPIRYASNYTVPLALAAMLVLAIGLYQLVPREGIVPVPGLPGSATQPQQTAQNELTPVQQKPARPTAAANAVIAAAQSLGTSLKGKELDVPFTSANKAGFTGNFGDKADRFHAGYALVMLGVSCTSGDTTTLRNAAASLYERIQRAELAEVKKSGLLRRIEKIATTPAIGRECTDTFIAADKELTAVTHDDAYLGLGLWVALVRVSAQSTEVTFTASFDENKLQQVQQELGNEISGKVTQIQVLIKAPLNDAARHKLAELADDIHREF